MSRRQDGFTIIELLIATMVFSVILMAATTALFQLEKMYYRGIITNRTQTASRQIMAELSQQLQLNKDNTRESTATYPQLPGLTVGSFCIDNLRYSFVKNVQVTDGVTYSDTNHQGPHALWRDTINSTADCTPLNLGLADPAKTTDENNLSIGGTNGDELLGQHMRLTNLSISSDNNCLTGGANSHLCSVSVGIIYGDDDLLAPDANNPTGCLTSFGDQWCAVSNLSTTVFKRL